MTLAACAASTRTPAPMTPRAPTTDRAEATFLVAGMRRVETISLGAATCTRIVVPLAGTLRDVDLVLIDDAGQVLARDTEAMDAPRVEVCTRAATAVHVLVRAQAGAGHARLEVASSPRRETPRASRSADIVEGAFVDLDEPGAERTLRVHAAELARRGFTRTEPFTDHVLDASRALEIPFAVAAGSCVTVSVHARHDLRLTLEDAAGRVRSVASREGELVVIQTCEEGALRARVEGEAGVPFALLIAYGDVRVVGGAAGLWLGHAVEPDEPR